jgi:protocadherin-15
MDINDKNPIFMHLPYEFEVSEGKVDAYVGTVKAVDDDLQENAIVVYSAPTESAFTIDPDSGDIFTSKALDYEAQKVGMYDRNKPNKRTMFISCYIFVFRFTTLL